MKASRAPDILSAGSDLETYRRCELTQRPYDEVDLSAKLPELRGLSRVS